MENLKERFRQIFGEEREDIRTFFAPGRVNLIGEHTDYNGGYVLPCSLIQGTYLVMRARKDSLVRLYSENFAYDGIIQFSLDELTYDKKHGWANYPKGVIAELGASFSIDHGADLFFYGNIPNGAGLSSSASIELVTAEAFNRHGKLQINRLNLVQLCQKVENQFMGIQCGIMDQFAVGMGIMDHAILLNCKRLKYQYLPLRLHSNSLIIANTNKKRELAKSAYNDRRSTCEAALKKLQHTVEMTSLSDLSPEEFDRYQGLLDDVERKRVHHVVTENDRTIKAAELLEREDLSGFGQLMKESHLSLKNDYEVTGKELDVLAELAWNHPGTIGARMTGAGFGGCTVNIVSDEDIESFIEEVGKNYREEIGYEAAFYVAKVGDGVKELSVGDGVKELSGGGNIE